MRVPGCEKIWTHAADSHSLRLGNTLIDERQDEHIPLETRPVHLMLGVANVLPQFGLPLAISGEYPCSPGESTSRLAESRGIGSIVSLAGHLGRGGRPQASPRILSLCT